MKRAVVITVLLLGAICRPAAAQIGASAPRFEVGGHVNAFAVFSLDGAGSTVLWGPRVSARVTDRLAVDVSADLQTHSHAGGYHTLNGMYYAVGRYTFRHSSSTGMDLFATFGAVGSFYRVSWPEYSYNRPDGVRITWPGGRRSRIDRPRGVVGGIGMERPLNSHVAVRLSGEIVFGQGMFVGTRFCGGLMVPIGSYRK